MKIFTSSFLTILILLMASGCSGKGRSGKGAVSETDTITVPDTGYTGIKQYYSANRLFSEVTFKNGIRHGEMKTYYPGGQLYQTFWYENGLREDSASWHYLEGQVFRLTPYKHDTIDGIQKQFYRTGKIKARIGYARGFRTPLLEEFSQTGARVGGYPGIAFSFTDNYSTTGRFRISLELTDKGTKVNFYRGEFTAGVFDSTKCVRLRTTDGKAVIDLRKTDSSQNDYIGVVGEILTPFGNRYLTYKKLELPYKDLK